MSRPSFTGLSVLLCPWDNGNNVYDYLRLQNMMCNRCLSSLQVLKMADSEDLGMTGEEQLDHLDNMEGAEGEVGDNGDIGEIDGNHSGAGMDDPVSDLDIAPLRLSFLQCKIYCYSVPFFVCARNWKLLKPELERWRKRQRS